MRRWLPPLLLLVGLIGAWQVAASSGVLADLFGIESFLVPSPAEIAESLWQSRALLAENAWVTLREMLLGLVVSLAIGIAFAFLMHLSGLVKDTFNPLIVASQTIPILVIAPILITWFGFGIWPKVAVIALICFFPVTLGALAGLGSADPEAAKMMRTLHASGRQILWRLETPTALPHFFTGARLAVVLAPIGAVFGEWVGASSGLGHMILQDNAQLETARVFAAVAILSTTALALFGLVAFAERRIVTWR
jgi:ABC-type nitrate/sulfonate/bicarbonate transport system permease component